MRPYIPNHESPLYTPTFQPPRRRWPGVLAAMIIGGAIAAIAVASFYDPRASDKLHETASAAARGGALVADRAASAVGDAGITAAVKTALAADPSLSALKIEVNTENGIVSLAGPAPDEKSKERAEVIAAAPQGVQRVDNRLVISPPATTTQ